MMYACNVVFLIASAVLYGITEVLTHDDTLVKVYHSKELFFGVVMIALTGVIGQVFVFFTVSLFNCYILTIITTTRKLFSVVLSNQQFHHNFTPVQWSGAGIVLLCTVIELFINKKGGSEEKKEEGEKKI